LVEIDTISSHRYAHSSDDTAGAVLAEAALVDGWVGIMVIEGEVGGDFEGIHLKAGECLDSQRMV
jgi:hypothetical protein